MFARVTTAKGDATTADAAIGLMREQVLGVATKMPGFRGGYWLIDEDRDRIVAITLFDSREAIEGTSATAEQVREQAAAAGWPTEKVEIMEVIAHAEARTGTTGPEEGSTPGLD